MLRDLVRAARPEQWTKNLLVFAGALFTGDIFYPHSLLIVLATFACFCLISSAGYLMNDIADVEQDRQHPTKRFRPLPSGKLSVRAVAVTAHLLWIIGLVGCLLIPGPLLWIAISYLMLTLLYSFWLKQVVILDVFAIAAGFVLRAVAGAVAIAVPISPWLLICTTLLALFLALSKRRYELGLEEAVALRPSLEHYSLGFVDQMISVVTSATVISYALYTFTSQTAEQHPAYLMLTIPFVLYGIFRYLYLTHHRQLGGNPELLLVQDKPLLINILLWAVVVGLIFYFGH